MRSFLENNEIDQYLLRVLKNIIARVVKQAVKFGNQRSINQILDTELKKQVPISKFFITNNYRTFPVNKNFIGTYIKKFFSYHLEIALKQYLKKQYFVDSLESLTEGLDQNNVAANKTFKKIDFPKKEPQEKLNAQYIKEKKLKNFLEEVTVIPEEEEKVKKAWTSLMGSLTPIEETNKVFKSYKPKNNSEESVDGNLATAGSLMGGVVGALDEHSIFQIQKGLPANKYAVLYKGELKIWSHTFNGGTRAKIPSNFVTMARRNALSIRNISKYAGYANRFGSMLGYYNAVSHYINGNYKGAVVEGISNRLSVQIAAKSRNVYAIAWAVGWEGGKTYGYVLDDNIPGYVKYFKNPIRKTFGFEPVPLPK